MQKSRKAVLAFSSIAAVASAGLLSPARIAYARQEAAASGAGVQTVTEGNVGDTLFDEAWQFRVLKVESASEYVPQLTQKAAEKLIKPVGDRDTLFVITCEVRNQQKTSAFLDLASSSDYPVALRDSDENSYPVLTMDLRTGDGLPYGRGGASDQTGVLLPGAKTQIVVLFSIPKSARPVGMLFGLRHQAGALSPTKGTTLHISLTGTAKPVSPAPVAQNPVPAATPGRTVPQSAPPAQTTLTSPISRPAPGQVLVSTVYPDASTAFDGDFEDGADGLQANWTATGEAFAHQPTFGENVSLRRAKPSALASLASLGGNYWNGAYPVNKHGNWWIGTAENRPRPEEAWGTLAPGAGGNTPQGTLTSGTVRLDKPFLSFQIGGVCPNNFALERLELLVMGAGGPTVDDFTVAKTAICTNREVMYTLTWDVRAYMGKPIRLRLVDASPAGHLNVDQIRFTDTAPPVTSAPVWGLADTHAHPAANKAFGGQLYWGDTVGELSTALADCTPGHGLGGTGLDTVGDALLAAPGAVGILTAVLASGITGPLHDARPMGDFSRAVLRAEGVTDAVVDRVFTETPARAINAPLFQPFVDLLNVIPLVNQKLIGQLALSAISGSFGHKTYGAVQDTGSALLQGNSGNNFDGWPRFDDKLHQHMHVEWVRRAYEGGLRLMVALAVNSEMLANIRPKPGGAVSDRDAIDAQIAAIKAMAARPENASWMEIAYLPADARRIIGQNKLALVLGIEVDTWGEAGSAAQSPGWGKETDLPRGEASTPVIAREVARLRAQGVRHVFPVHLANNAFGGCSIYEDIFNFNQYALRQSFVAIDNDPAAFDNNFWGVQFRLFDKPMWSSAIDLQPVIANILRRPDLNPLRLAGGLTVNLGTMFADFVRIKPAYDAVRLDTSRSPAVLVSSEASTHGHLNALGLTPPGKNLINVLMRNGMIIDVDHMSRKATDDTLNIVEAYTDAAGNRGYPVTSGHSSFRPVSLRRDETLEEAKWPHESDKSDEHVRRIIALGGMVAPISTERDARQVGSSIPNDCAGSSKSWAQEYLYALQLTGGKNIGIGTDMAMLGGFGPRFGTRAAHARTKEEETHNEFRLMPRRAEANAQTRGVAYKTPLHDLRPFRWEDEADLYDHDERNAFLAVAAALDPAFRLDRDEGKLRPVLNFGETIVETLFATQSKWMINVVKGFRGIVEAPLLGDAYKGPDIQQAAKEARHNIDDPAHPVAPPSNLAGSDLYQTTYRRVTTAYRQYHEFATGGPDALTRCVAGPREFDFNFDGLAHYGMLPDFLQDVHNVGLSYEEMAPLFSSAEAYIQMWEKCEARAGINR